MHSIEIPIIILRNMDLSNKKILITGADGFIGSHLTEKLVRSGADVRAFVFYNSLILGVGSIILLKKSKEI